MPLPQNEPVISVGLAESSSRIIFDITGKYLLDNTAVSQGRYEAYAGRETVTLLNSKGECIAKSPELHFLNRENTACFFTIPAVTIGRNFHWEQFQNQKFQGGLILKTSPSKILTVINRIPLEMYLESVICSEMSSECPEEFLNTHCVISRSWLLAQLQKKNFKTSPVCRKDSTWTDSGFHRHFDVCADDHCQRYHGTEHVNTKTQKAVHQTRGEVLVFENEICDTRFSKCCGGITERFSTAWDDREVPYLRSVSDCPDPDHGLLQPVFNETQARHFIFSRPGAYCNIEKNINLLTRILPEFDFKTENFFRWQISIPRDELRNILFNKTGIDFGEIRQILPLSRGDSGRIYRLKIRGEKQEKIFGKELEIRRVLSPAHLYSSAFVVEPFSKGFKLSGAGWGHGVGLCQIGAAAMAEQGCDCKKILCHYFRGAELKKIY